MKKKVLAAVLAVSLVFQNGAVISASEFDSGETVTETAEDPEDSGEDFGAERIMFRKKTHLGKKIPGKNLRTLIRMKKARMKTEIR